jgi:hypothetical protein
VTLTIELSEEEARLLAAKARAQGASVQQYAHELLRRGLEGGTKLPLSARIAGLWSDMPPDVRAQLPADGARQVDHYVYGLPKNRQRGTSATSFQQREPQRRGE